MEFASEMVVKATLYGLRIAEVPTALSRDGRSRSPHLHTWRDGWRHLRFLLLYSPRWLFFYPGLVLMIAGLLMMLWLMPGPRKIGAITLDINTMLFSCTAIILGLQAVSLALFSKVFAVSARLVPEDVRLSRIVQIVSLERAIIVGLLFSLAGSAGLIYAVVYWGEESFGPLVPSVVMRISIPSFTALAIGVQIISGAFFLTTLTLKRK
jgi:hypothetical protein